MVNFFYMITMHFLFIFESDDIKQICNSKGNCLLPVSDVSSGRQKALALGHNILIKDLGKDTEEMTNEGP